MSEPILTVDHLSFGFRDQQLYQDLSFQLNVGSMTSLVGPNGVGKTTLIRLLMAKTASRNDSLSATATGSIGLCAAVPEC